MIQVLTSPGNTLKDTSIIKSYQLPGHSTTLSSWHINVIITDFPSQITGVSDPRKISINKTEASTELHSCSEKQFRLEFRDLSWKENRLHSYWPILWKNIQGSGNSEQWGKHWAIYYPFYARECIPPQSRLLHTTHHAVTLLLRVLALRILSCFPRRTAGYY